MQTAMNQTKAFSADVTAKEGERAVTARISTNVVDRDGEVLLPLGCNWKDFQSNPVLCLQHCYYTLPVGKVVALTRDEKSITAKVIFAERPPTHPAGDEWIPDTLLALYQQKVLNAFSVGFIATETRAATSKDIVNFGDECRRVTSKWKLLELSCVTIGCNQEAVALAVSKGIVSPAMAKDVWGVEAKADEPTACPEGECESRDPACEGCPNAKAAEPQPKRLTYFIEPNTPPQPDLASVAAKQAAAAIAKARGAIYYV
jgi:hypothetical protein